MWIILLVLSIGSIAGYLGQLASRPLATLVATVRVLLFVFGALTLVIYFVYSAAPEATDDGRTAALLTACSGFAAWLLTFIIPAVLSAFGRSRRAMPPEINDGDVR